MPLPCSCSWFYKLVTHYNTLSGLCFCARAGDWQKMCSLICYGNVTVKLSPIQKDKSCWTTETFLDQSINHYNSFTNWIWTRSFDSCFVMRILCDWCDVDLSSPFSGWPLLYMCWCSVRYWGRWIHKQKTMVRVNCRDPVSCYLVSVDIYSCWPRPGVCDGSAYHYNANTGNMELNTGWNKGSRIQKWARTQA